MNDLLRDAERTWHGVRLNQPNWNDDSHTVALEAVLAQQGERFFLITNAYWEPLDFELPKSGGAVWRRWIDTSLDSPQDIVPWEIAPEVIAPTYCVQGRTVVMLFTNDRG